MAEKTIGRVSVKVTPDTSKFREEAKAKLDAEERRLPELDVTINVRIAESSATQVVAQARAIRRAAQAAMEDIDLKVNLDDRTSVQSALSRIGAELRRIGEIELNVGLNEDDLNAAKDLLEERLKDIGVDLKVDIDDKASIERAIRRINAELSDLRAIDINVRLNEGDLEAARALLQERLRDIEVDVEPEVDPAANTKVAAVLAFLTRTRDVVIRPVMDKTAVAAISFVSVLSGFDALRRNIDQAREAFLGLFTRMPEIMAIVPPVLMLTGAFASMTANIFGLVGSLAQAVPILLSLPGIAIGIGTMVAAFKDFASVLPGVVSQFKELQPMISAAFWEQAKGPIKALANSVMPALRTGLQGTAGALGGFFSSLSGALQTVLVDGGALGAWFANLNASILIFTGYTEPLAGIFRIFGDIGSLILPQLAQYMGELAVRFEEFMNALVNGAGGLGPFVDQTMAAFKGIVEFVLSIGNVFSAVFASASAAGAATFQSLADHLNTFAEYLRLPGVAEGMTNLFGAAFAMFDNFFAGAMPALQSFLSGFGGVLTAVLPEVGRVLGVVAQAFGSIFDNEAAMAGLEAFVGGILLGVQAILPALAPVGDLIASLGPTLGLLANQIGVVFGALAPSFGNIITALTPVIQLLSNGLARVLIALQPALEQLGAAIALALANPAFIAAITAVVDAVLALVPALTPLIALAANLVSALLPVVSAILTPMSTLIAAITPLLTPLVGVITSIVGAVAPLIPMLVDLLMSIIQPILPILVQLVSSVLPLLVAPLQLTGAILSLILPILMKLVEIALPPLAALLELVAGVISGVFNWAFEQFGGVIEKAQGWIQGFTETIDGFSVNWTAVWNGIVNFFEGVWDAIKRFFTEGFAQAKLIVTNGLNNIKQFFTDGMNNAKNIVKNGIESVKTFFSNGLDNLKNAVSNAWTAVKNFFSDGISNAVKLVKELPGKITSALGNLTRTLVDKGKDLIQGFINGITSMAGKIVSTIKSTITDRLPQFVKDALGISSPSRVFHEFGQNLMQGLAEGIEDESAAVLRALKAVMNEVEGTEFRIPTTSLGVGPAAYTAAGMQPVGNTLIYNAAPGVSFGAEEDLFTALGRARGFGGW